MRNARSVCSQFAYTINVEKNDRTERVNFNICKLKIYLHLQMGVNFSKLLMLFLTYFL